VSDLLLTFASQPSLRYFAMVVIKDAVEPNPRNVRVRVTLLGTSTAGPSNSVRGEDDVDPDPSTAGPSNPNNSAGEENTKKEPDVGCSPHLTIFVLTLQKPEVCFETHLRRPVGSRFRAATQMSQSIRGS
jgi:hypothetical protein